MDFSAGATGLFVQLYQVCEVFFDYLMQFVNDFLLAPFPYTHQIIEFMDAFEFADLLPDVFQFFIWAEYYEWSTGIMMLIGLVTIWVIFRIYLFLFNAVTSLLH